MHTISNGEVMLEPQARKTALYHIEVDLRKRREATAGVVAAIVQDMISRGLLNSTVTQTRICQAIADEFDVRARLAWQTLARVVREPSASGDPDRLANALKSDIAAVLTDNCDDLSEHYRRTTQYMNGPHHGMSPLEQMREQAIVAVGAEIDLALIELSHADASPSSTGTSAAPDAGGTSPSAVSQPCINAACLRQLLSQPESEVLDFKQKMFASGSPPPAKAEFIKDILAFANTPRSAPAHILIGIAHEHGVATPVGIPVPRDDAEFQNLFHDRTNRRPRFQYHEVELDGTRIGIFSIAASQPRPLFLTSDYHGLRENVIYRRCGSTTVAASPDEWTQLVPHVERPRPTGPVPAGGAVEAIARRWWSVFESHGVHLHQIPKLLPQFPLPPSALADWRETADLLTDDLRDATCELFGIRRSWLEGDDSRIYTGITIDKRVEEYLGILVNWRKQTEDVALLAFRDGGKELEQRPEQNIGLMLRMQIHEFGEKPVFRYAPIWNLDRWGWDGQRILAKLVILAAVKLECDFQGYILKRGEIESLCEGMVFPELVLKNPWSQEWHPDDYIYRSTESAVAKDAAEVDAVYERARKIGYLDRLRDAQLQLGIDPEGPWWLRREGSGE